MRIRKHSEKILTFIWCAILCVYWIAILCINFSQNPRLYYTDMYSDMNYAAEAWIHKSIAPEGWIFGNQRYVVATPVLAAVFFGLTGNQCIAMGLASTLMGLGTLLSFSWMLRPIFTKLHQRLAAMVAFMSVILLAGDAAFYYNGWQLFFTMCSYYACYAITLFLAFGCYLRRNAPWSPKTYIPLLVTCLLSVGTGMQSLRQTIIMVCPLLAAEFLRIANCIVHKKPIAARSLLIAGAISLSNFFGILLAELFPVEQVTIYGQIKRNSLSNMIRDIIPSISNAFSLFEKADIVAAVIFLAICGYMVYRVIRDRSLAHDHLILCTFLFLVGIVAVIAIDIVTTMHIREIYYFPLYALAAIWAAWLYAHSRKTVRICAATALCACFTVGCVSQLPRFLRLPQSSYPVETVSEYLEENGITTIYSRWNHGEIFAIASDFSINAGFWSATGTPFIEIDYLCDPAVFDADASECAYLFHGEEAAAVGVETAREQNTELVFMKYFPQYDLYIYTADINLMH